MSLDTTVSRVPRKVTKAKTDKPAADTLADDLLHGAKSIADFLGLKPWKKVYPHLKSGNIPNTRMGDLYIASKTGLRRHFNNV